MRTMSIPIEFTHQKSYQIGSTAATFLPDRIISTDACQTDRTNQTRIMPTSD
jgi:hypothetical protein